MPLAVQALALGLSTGMFCLGFCYPILAPVLLSRGGRRARDTIASLGLFLLGRLAAYLLVGLAVGLARGAAEVVAAGIVGRLISPLAFVLLGALLALYGLIDRLPRVRFCTVARRAYSRPSALLPLGFLAGLSPCPPFLLAAAAAFEAGTPWRSSLFFLFFFAGTSVYLLPFAFSWLLARSRSLGMAARLSAIVAGGWFVWLGARGFIGG